MPIKSDLDELTNVFLSTNSASLVRRLMILHRTQQGTLFDIRITDLHRYVITGLLCALNVPAVSSADAEAEHTCPQ